MVGCDTGKVRTAPDIGSFSPLGEEYWGQREKFFKFLARGANILEPIAAPKPFYSETVPVAKLGQIDGKSGKKAEVKRDART